jgi:enoyl-CoA hydratase/carnithine racemase
VNVGEPPSRGDRLPSDGVCYSRDVTPERRDGVVWLTFERPERLNAFQSDDYRALDAALAAAAADPESRVVVLTGTGRAFSAGADRSLVDGTATAVELTEAGTAFNALIERLVTFPKPLFAAVNGLAVGFGATLLVHCDLVLMAETARVRFPFTALGIVPEAGSSALLSTRARSADGVWAMLSSEWIGAADAVAMGLAWRAVPAPELVASTQRAATTVAALDPDAVAATKRLLTHGRADLCRAAMRRETAAMADLVGHPTDVEVSRGAT